ncbi:hypothetical protein C8039_09925 [Halogeometricum sp. wsp3]|nr:hypothetical protein C8039_09925 [Halogeometricum sp. wsp3]
MQSGGYLVSMGILAVLLAYDYFLAQGRQPRVPARLVTRFGRRYQGPSLDSIHPPGSRRWPSSACSTC